jgi:long-chain acyl-CoA synthetase
MKGYFNRPTDTARAIDTDGWFHTEDQGHFDANGHLRITGRIKDLIITSYGKKVVPTPIEDRINKSAFVEQAVLCGDGEKYIGALIVPQRAAIERYAAEHGIRASSYTELLHCQEIEQLITAEIEKANMDCAPFEKVKGFRLLAESFTVENGLLTPTLKVRRKMIRERFRAEIHCIFAETKGS